MATNLRPKRLHIPVIPSSATVQERLDQVQAEAKKLGILLRLAIELEQVESSASEGQEASTASEIKEARTDAK